MFLHLDFGRRLLPLSSRISQQITTPHSIQIVSLRSREWPLDIAERSSGVNSSSEETHAKSKSIPAARDDLSSDSSLSQPFLPLWICSRSLRISRAPQTGIQAVFSLASELLPHFKSYSRDCHRVPERRDQPNDAKARGHFAISFNRRKHRSGVFWEDRYHCTMVEDGEHLWNCIQYVDLNMVRAGVVLHPCDWSWCGYQELVGEKTRYRLLDMDRLLELLGYPNTESFKADYCARIQRAVAEKKLNRNRCWTESIAVGRKAYVTKIAAAIRYERLKPRIEEREDGSWAVWEQPSDYRAGSTHTPYAESTRSS